LKITATSLNFLASLLIAHLLGVAGYGAYAYAQSWVYLLLVPAVLGLDLLLVRNVAAYRARFEWGLLNGFLRWTKRVVLATSVGIALLATTAASFFFGKSLEPQMLPAFLVAMSLLPLAALISIQQAAMRGLQRVVFGLLPEAFIRPILFLILLGIAYPFLGEDLGAAGAVGLSGLAAAVAVLFGARLLRKAIPQSVTQAAPTYRVREWMRSVPPLLFLSGTAMMVTSTIPTLLLGTIKGAEAAGVYAAVGRVSILILFIMLAANAALAPAIAEMYVAGEMARLRRLVMKSTRLMLLFSSPIALCLIVFNRQVLLIFGEEFTQGGAALSILSLSYLFNVATGSAGTLLTMTGHERDAALAIGASGLLNVILNVALIPGYGLEGAAIAAAVSLFVSNLLLTAFSYKRLGIHASALGRIG
jgi:O-antigen/teichoic acid export membrane protein